MDSPSQIDSVRHNGVDIKLGQFDVREHLIPRRMTIVMWDDAFLLRHIPGGSFEDYDRVLNETIERGYNTVRLDPLPQWIDLDNIDEILHWPDPQLPYMPWNHNSEVIGPVGKWLCEFMEKLLNHGGKIHYILSAWWFWNNPDGTFSQGPKLKYKPTTHKQAAEVWLEFLGKWKKRFGFDYLGYVDIANEIPYFLPEYLNLFSEKTGGCWESPQFTPEQIEFLSEDINGAIAMLQREYPELLFTGSIHGDLRWMDVPLNFDCLDVHFYADADPRWKNRTRFGDYMEDLYTSSGWHKEFSDACMKAQRAAAPMFRARQRGKLAYFAKWSQQMGMPLTTSESWASWFYYDSPDLDWRWLLEWAEWSVEDAIEFKMWGWTPHNYVQPQFKNWQDIQWHRRLTQKFINS